MDITYELSRIAAAKYGLHLKDPIFAAFDKLVTDSKFNLLKDDFQDDFADYEAMLTRFNDDETLSYILRDFLELYTILNGRMGFYAKHENPNEDEQISYWIDILIQELMNVANNNATRSLPMNSYGIFNAVKIRASMYHILDILRYPNAVYGETATYKKKDPLYIYGRDISGIRVYGNKDGVGELYFDSGLPKIKIKIRVTPIMVDEEPVTMQSSFTRGQLHEGDYVDFPIPSTLKTRFSIFKVEILDYETELGVTYKLTRASYIPTTEDDYLRHNDGSETTVDKYIGVETRISMPSVMDELPVVVIGKTAFMGSDIEGVKIPEGVETIE